MKSLASSGEPFNFTMLTVDTHFTGGYFCELCEDKYDNQYSNVYACSSKQVADFIQWIQEQPFYENTTIVITGDHPTMDSDYISSEQIPEDYNRKTYTAIINPEEGCENSYREYSTYDLFPTTLAAMGAKIEGNRLGLGVNLFSSEPTLVEQYGVEHINAELKKRSIFYEKDLAADVKITDEEKLEQVRQVLASEKKIIMVDRLNIIDNSSFERALVGAYEKGSRLFEVELKMSDEGIPVCVFDDNMSAVSIDDVAKFMNEHTDVYFVVDDHDSDSESCKPCEYILTNYRDIRNRFIIQIHDENHYQIIRDKGFISVILALDTANKAELTKEKLKKYVGSMMLLGFSFEDSLIDDKSFFSAVKKQGIPMYVYDINDKYTMQTYYDKGISCVFTDDLD